MDWELILDFDAVCDDSKIMSKRLEENCATLHSDTVDGSAGRGGKVTAAQKQNVVLSRA